MTASVRSLAAVAASKDHVSRVSGTAGHSGARGRHRDCIATDDGLYGLSAVLQVFWCLAGSDWTRVRTILVRSAIQLVLLLSIALLALVLASAAAAFYAGLGYAIYRWKRGNEAANLGRLYPHRAGRFGTLSVVVFGMILAFTFVADLVFPRRLLADGSVMLALTVVLPLLFVVFGEHSFLRLRRRSEPSLLDLSLAAVRVSAERRFVVIAVSLRVGSFSAGLTLSLS